VAIQIWKTLVEANRKESEGKKISRSTMAVYKIFLLKLF
jgi:hypothetical protein